MDDQNRVALIAAGQGSLRDALFAMLLSMPGVEIIEASDTGEAVVALRAHHPEFVIIDSALPGNHTMQLVETIERQKPGVRCAILVDTVLQQAAALKAGADRALLKGEPPVRLFAQVEQLLKPTRLSAAAG